MGTYILPDTLFVLIRPIDLGDRFHGVFTSRPNAERALEDLILSETQRLGVAPTWLAKIRIEAVPLNQLHEL